MSPRSRIWRRFAWQGSEADYDGDGNVEEGIVEETAGLQEILYAGIQTYATDKAGAAIVYNSAAYPYFFGDANDNGQADEGEEGYAILDASPAEGGLQLPGRQQGSG